MNGRVTSRIFAFCSIALATSVKAIPRTLKIVLGDIADFCSFIVIDIASCGTSVMSL